MILWRLEEFTHDAFRGLTSYGVEIDGRRLRYQAFLVHSQERFGSMYRGFIFDYNLNFRLQQTLREAHVLRLNVDNRLGCSRRMERLKTSQV